jgi:hypothetical protein
MKKIILLAVAVLMTATSALAAISNPAMPVSRQGYGVQQFAPISTKGAALTVASTTVDMSADLQWEFYGTTACKYRTMPTSTKAGFAMTLPANAFTSRAVNKAAPFVNFSGCTSGEYTRQ